MDEFLEQLRLEFERRIATKTGWGKNDVMIEFDKACISALLGYMKKVGIDPT